MLIGGIYMYALIWFALRENGEILFITTGVK